MVLVLGKDLDKFNDSLATREPYMLKDDSPVGPRYMTGAELMRSARITDEWKIPDAFYAQAYNPKSIAGQITSSALSSMGDIIANTPAELENLAAQRAIEIMSGDKKETTKGFFDKVYENTEIAKAAEGIANAMALGVIIPGLIEDRKETQEKLRTQGETVSLLKNRDYPSAKYARRVIAETTDDVQTRQLVRELYNQSQGIDSTKWYNETATIIGAMIPTMALARFGGGVGLRTGLSRAGATRLATGIIAGTSGLESAGQYAQETAADYLARTGDRTFSNFTANDATGLSAMAYGAMAGATETIGGAEMLVTGALKRAGIKSLGRAVVTTGAGEALEESLQTLEEGLSRVVDRTNNKTLGEWLEEAAVGAAYGFFIGGATGAVAHASNRQNIIRGIKKLFPNLEDADVNKVADTMIDSVGEISSRDPGLWGKLRQKVAYMYQNADIDNKEDRIDAITDLEYSLIVTDSVINGMEVADNPLFKGEVNVLGWFRDGIPENRRAEINSLVTELESLQTELKKLNEAEEKDWEAIERVENKLDKFDEYVLEKLSDMARLDARQVGDLLARNKNNFVSRELKKNLEKLKDINKTTTQDVVNALIEQGYKARFETTKGKKGVYSSDHTSTYFYVAEPDGKEERKFRISFETSASRKNKGHKTVDTSYYGDTPVETIVRDVIARMGQKFNPKEEIIHFGKPVVNPYQNILFQDEFSLADENARLDDIYPEYTGETINIDGKERSVYNSNGERIAQSEPALRNFYKWFGDSKVVDEQGRPLIVYHGTKAQFNEFLGEKIGQSGTSEGVGFYFTNDKNIATGFGDVMSVYLKLEKPVYAYAQVFMAEDYDGDLDTMEANAKMIRNASMQVLEDLKAKGYEFYDETTSQMADIYTETDYDSLVNTIEMYIKDGIKAEEYDENKLYNDIREAIIKEFGFDGFKTKRYNYSDSTVYVALMSNQIKSIENRGTYSSDTGNIYRQSRASGGAPTTYRGAYIPIYRFIQRSNRMDASTLSHELAHDWFSRNFDRYRSGKASKEFMRSWGALEKALGISENAAVPPKKASEAFARAYEGWIMEKTDWSQIINIEDKDKDSVIKLMQDYQAELRDIYQDLTSDYFKDTWGKLGELKPKLKEWFDFATNIKDLDILVSRGEMTADQAQQEKINQALDTVIENTENPESKKQLKIARTLNDTNRYEAEGGNKNSLQKRLASLAQAIDENNLLIKENYDTHRDMLEVAKQADNFVRTRLDDALRIINGEMAEQEGLFKEDIYTALERLALENGDLNLLDELKNSEIANRLAKELGQRVAGFRNWSAGQVDVVSAVKSLDIKFDKALKNKKAQKQLSETTKLFEQSQAEQDRIADKQLDETLKELECQ